MIIVGFFISQILKVYSLLFQLGTLCNVSLIDFFHHNVSNYVINLLRARTESFCASHPKYG